MEIQETKGTLVIPVIELPKNIREFRFDDLKKIDKECWNTELWAILFAQRGFSIAMTAMYHIFEWLNIDSADAFLKSHHDEFEDRKDYKETKELLGNFLILNGQSVWKIARDEANRKYTYHYQSRINFHRIAFNMMIAHSMFGSSAQEELREIFSNDLHEISIMIQ